MLGGILGELANDVKLALEAERIVGPIDGQAADFLDEDLPNHRLAALGGGANGLVVGRHGAPADDLLAFVAHNLLEHLLAEVTRGGVLRQEDDADAVLARLRQMQVERRELLDEEAVRHLHEDARAIASVFLAATGAAMLHVAEDIQGLAHDVMRLAALQVHEKADAARIVFIGRIIQTLRSGCLRVHDLTPSSSEPEA